jgi:glycosyl transferase family 25
MIPVIVINLDRAEDRRKRVCEHLNSLGYAFVIMPGVDRLGMNVRELPVDWKRSEYELRGRGGVERMTPGELGCLLSHRKAWQFITDARIDRALIVEDDVVMKRPAHEVEQLLWRFIHDEPDFKLLQCNEVRTDMLTRRSEGYYVELQESPMGAYGYMVSQSYARRLLEVTHTLYIPTDVFFRRESVRTSGLFLLRQSVCGHVGDIPSYVGHEEQGIAAA